MTKIQKKLLLISVVLIALFGTATIIFFVIQKLYIEKQFTQDESVIVTSNLVRSQQSAINELTSDWFSFHSAENLKLDVDFSFRYPSTWIQKGSMDSDSLSIVPFFEKNKYSQECKERDLGGVVCEETGKVAIVMVNNSSLAETKIEYENEIRKSLVINGYTATEISGKLKTSDGRIGKIGQEEVRVIIEDIGGFRLELAMLIKDVSEKALFDEILRTIVFDKGKDTKKIRP